MEPALQRLMSLHHFMVPEGLAFPGEILHMEPQVLLALLWEYNQSSLGGTKGLISRRAEHPQLDLEQFTKSPGGLFITGNFSAKTGCFSQSSALGIMFRQASGLCSIGGHTRRSQWSLFSLECMKSNWS